MYFRLTMLCNKRNSWHLGEVLQCKEIRAPIINIYWIKCCTIRGLHNLSRWCEIMDSNSSQTLPWARQSPALFLRSQYPWIFKIDWKARSDTEGPISLIESMVTLAGDIHDAQRNRHGWLTLSGQRIAGWWGKKSSSQDYHVICAHFSEKGEFFRLVLTSKRWERPFL